jgi:hypothetical protein
MTYELEKKIWSDKDFEQMGWHDCRIYKIRLTEDLELDIDYILQWNKADLEGMPFTFWVAPATLIFKNIKDLRLDIDTAFDDAIEIQDIERTQKDNVNRWTIITQQGDFEFISDGYEQFIRQEPFSEFGQTISFIERNGSSLDRTTNQENPNRNREDIVDRRKKDLEHYENAKKRHLKRLEKEHLDKAKENNEIDAKQYLLKKKEVKEMLDNYDHLLKNTIFENW